MALDVELYRRTVYVPRRAGEGAGLPRRISAIDMQPGTTARTLVFVHGYGGNALQWLFQLRLFGQSVRVVAPEMRGHGLSDDPPSLPLTMGGLVEDLEIVLAGLDVARPFYLVAHSFGGAVACEYTLRHPEEISGIVLIGVPTRFMVRPLVRRVMLVPDPAFSFVVKLARVALYARQRTLKPMLEHVMSTWQGAERLRQLRVPALVVLGQRDTVFQRQYYEAVPRCIPHAQQIVIPVSAHLVQLERPDAVNRAIRRFLEPRPRDTLALKSEDVARSAASAARMLEMPWLQHYDREVPHTLAPSRQLVHELLSNAARDYPFRPALLFFGQKIRYRELDLLSNRFAHVLRALGVRAGDRVAVVLPNLPQCVIAYYGTLKAAAVVVLGSPLSSEEEIAHQLRDAGAVVLLTLASYRARAERICVDTGVKHVIFTDVREYLPLSRRVLLAGLLAEGGAGEALSEEGAESTAASAAARAQHMTGAAARKPAWRAYALQELLRLQRPSAFDAGATAQDLALLQYTSGTSDLPRGVMLAHDNLMANVLQQRHWLGDVRRGREIVLGVLPLSHSYGMTSCMNMAMALAGSLVLLPTRRTEQILSAIRTHRPSLFPGVPDLYLAIANHPRVRSFGIASIRVCISGSAPLPVEVQEAFEKLTKGRLVEGYGLTEASPSTHSNPLKGERRVGSIGIPLPETRARIVDLKTGGPLAAGEVGELLVRGPQVMRGYWQMPAETAQALQDGWLHTGDLARMDEDGFFTIVDRKKDLILSGTYNVYPRDVEEVLYEHPKVLEAAVVSTYATTQAHPAAGESTQPISPLIKAVVVLKRGEKATADELLALCRERLDAYKVPALIEFRSELPKNVVGKVLRRLLVEA